MGEPLYKKPRLIDPSVDDTRMCTPVAFTAMKPKPRMYMLPLKPRSTPLSSALTTTKVGEGASSSAAGAAAAGLPLNVTTAVAKNALATDLLPKTEGEVTAKQPLVRPPVLQNLDDYLALVGNMYYQSPEVGRSNGGFSLIRRTTLGMLTAPVREPSVLDKWSPYEIALFESSICLVGKLFHQIAANIKTKTTGEVIEFYYVWKKSKNYAAWKATYRHLVLLD